jgi:iron complex outermembrane recepter protein
MKFKTIPILSAFLLLFPIANSLSGQSAIRGYVANPDNEPAAYSTAILMNRDSVNMTGMLIGEDGSFIFDRLPAGNYLIKVSSVEFNPYISSLITLNGKDMVELDKIQLSTRLNDLGEVVFVGEKALIEVRSDKTVFNVSASANATGNNAMELLAKAPGVRIDMDNNIILQGKSGVQIYINGRPSRLSGSDLSNMLEGMQSDNIESIELITNPSSKYDAEGTGGIINIVLKKNVSSGFNGSFTGNLSQGTRRRSDLGTTLNYSGEKVNFFSSLNLSDNEYTFNLDELNIREAYSLQMLSISPTDRKGINFSGGLDYKITNEQSLSFDARVQVNDRYSPSYSSTVIESLLEAIPDERLDAETISDGGSNNYTSNLHYSFTPNKSSELTLDVSYGYYNNQMATEQPNRYYSMDSLLLRSSESHYDTYTGIDLFSSQVDYRRSIGKANFSTGAKYSYISTRNTLDYFDLENSVPVPNPDRSNDFNYLEKIAAAYAILSMQATDRISLNAGMRVENTSSLGQLISDDPGPDDVVPRNYTNVFPNVSMSYDDKETHAVSLSYGRRINRPNYQYLNPFESRSSEISAWKGNPFLEPNYISNYQVSYSLKRKLVISNNYSVTNNFFANILLQNGEKGNIMTPSNLDKAIVNGLSVSYPLSVTKWWEFSSFLIYNYEAYSGNVEGSIIDLKAHILNFRMQNNLKLPWGIQMELTGEASSPHIWRGSLRIEEYWRLSAGLKKGVFNNRLLLQVAARDLFNTGSNYYYTSSYGGMIFDGVAFFDGRRISFSATYKFGEQDAKNRRRKSSLDSELNRISD